MSLEIKKIKAELARVVAARMELEFRQEEIKESFDRMTGQIKIQLDKEVELQQKLKEIEL